MQGPLRERCSWADSYPLYSAYHDEEWGVPLHDDMKLFEFLVLNGAQAGLSWITILKKRRNYRKAFDNFDAAKIAEYGPKEVERLLSTDGIIRNRMKIESAISNARAFLGAQKEFGTFDKYVWQFVSHKSKKNRRETDEEIPAVTPESEAMGKDLKKRGFSFVGPTICYAFMQATGMVNDHTISCFRYKELAGMR